ncbi:MAG: SulP family inorganic anion transporter [Acidimicrobiales bacterium]|nr:SulP family inorganic anion transporter [Acidimicrobiales bacterium]
MPHRRRRMPSVPHPGAAIRSDGRWRSVRELFAGVTLAALALPLNIGYATAAGLPASVGIYSTLLPLALFACTTGSRRLVVGPDATIAALLAAAVAPLVAAGHDPEELAWAASLLVAASLLASWLLRLGGLVRFLSRAVLAGFIAGLAVEVITSQVRKIMAVDVEADTWVREVLELVRAVPDASGASVVVGLSTIVLVRLVRRFAPALPGALLVLTLVTVVVALVDPEGVAVLGEVPSTLPRPTFPTIGLDVWLELLPTALAIAALTIAEGLLIAQSAARRHGEELEPNGEIFSFGVANVAAGLSGGMPIGASASRTAAMGSVGSTTQVPSVVAALVVALVVLVFSDAVAELPTAALAGLVANAVVSTVDVPEFRRLARVRRTELGIALGCAAGVLLLGPLRGIGVAALVSALDVVRRAADAPWANLRSAPSVPERGRYTAAGIGETVLPGLVVVRPGGPLFFANADQVRGVLEAAASSVGGPDEVRWLALDLETVSDVDPTAAEALEEGLAAASASGVVVVFSRVQAPVLDLLRRYGIVTGAGRPAVHESNRAVEEAYRATVGG